MIKKRSQMKRRVEDMQNSMEMKKKGAITPWEVSPISIATQLHMDLVIDTGNRQWSTTWPTNGLGDRLCNIF